MCRSFIIHTVHIKVNHHLKKFGHAAIMDFSSIKADPLFGTSFMSGSFFSSYGSINHRCEQFGSSTLLFPESPLLPIQFPFSPLTFDTFYFLFRLLFYPCLLHSPRTHIKRGPARTPTCGHSPATSPRDGKDRTEAGRERGAE